VASGVARRLQHAQAGGAGGGEDDVRALRSCARVSSAPRAGSVQAAGVLPAVAETSLMSARA
jgi:hypothetical protein